MLCTKCKQETAPDANELAKAFLPPNVELYDFGGGTEVLPVPDVTSTDSYFSSTYVGGLISLDEPHLLLAFHVPYTFKKNEPFDLTECLLDSAKKALRFWPERARPRGEQIVPLTLVELAGGAA